MGEVILHEFFSLAEASRNPAAAPTNSPSSPAGGRAPQWLRDLFPNLPLATLEEVYLQEVRRPSAPASSTAVDQPASMADFCSDLQGVPRPMSEARSLEVRQFAEALHQ